MKWSLPLLAFAWALSSCGIDPQKVLQESPPFVSDDQLSCSPSSIPKVKLGAYQAQTKGGQLYLRVITLVQQTIVKEENIVPLTGKQQPVASLDTLLGRSLTVEEQRQRSQLKSEFTSSLRTILGSQYHPRTTMWSLLHSIISDAANQSEASLIATAREIEILATLASRPHAKASRAVYRSRVYNWPEGRVVYSFDPEDDKNIPAQQLEETRNQVRWAAQLWEQQTNGVVRFIERDIPPTPPVIATFLYGPHASLKISTRKEGHAHFVGWATIGHTLEKERNIMWVSPEFFDKKSLDRQIGAGGSAAAKARALNKARDITRKIALHEFGHVLGLDHEHTRSDRDDYLDHAESDVMYTYRDDLSFGWKHVRFGAQRISLPYFRVCPGASNLRGSSYDYFSVMHYTEGVARQRQTATLQLTTSNGSTQKRSVTVHPGESILRLQRRIGQQAFLSPQDIATIKRLYRGRP